MFLSPTIVTLKVLFGIFLGSMGMNFSSEYECEYVEDSVLDKISFAF